MNVSMRGEPLRDFRPAMWRRIRLIPFRRAFEGTQKDAGLLEKLKAEATGILNWAVQGCLAWQREGLEPPAAVLEATGEYKQESDTLGPFFDDRCIVEPTASVPSAELWGAYQQWAELNGEKQLSRTAFAEHLKALGCTSGEEGHAKQRVWRGLALRAESGAGGHGGQGVTQTFEEASYTAYRTPLVVVGMAASRSLLAPCGRASAACVTRGRYPAPFR
jgi:putative DNA primase/helicase